MSREGYALEVDNVALRIDGTPILRGVDFTVRPGEVTGLIGPNGSGKTSLFNCISGFHRVSKGTIKLNGIDVTDWEPYQRARAGLGRVFQNFGIFKEMTVLENILIALESHDSWWRLLVPWGNGLRAKREAVMGFLEQIGLAELADRPAGVLSGGQMRLLEIVRTLAFEAEVLLLDEPTAGVSPKMKDDIVVQISKLQSLGKTVLVIEHDMNFIEQFCQRVIVLDVGEVVLDDTLAEVRSSQVLQEIYFGRKTRSG